MEQFLSSMPLYIVLPVAAIAAVFIVLVVLKSFKEGREISFWPPRIGARIGDRASGNTDLVADRHEKNLQSSHHPALPSVEIPAKPIAMLRFISGVAGVRTGMTFLITDDHRSFTMGRAPTCDIVINDPRASRSQVRINVLPCDPKSTNYQVELVDTSTLKNTFVNGNRIDRAVLQNQDMVQVAEHTFVFYLVGA